MTGKTGLLQDNSCNYSQLHVHAQCIYGHHHHWHCATCYCNCLCTTVVCQIKTMKWQVKFKFIQKMWLKTKKKLSGALWYDSTTYDTTTCKQLAPQHTASGLMNTAASSDEYDLLTLSTEGLPIPLWHDRPYIRLNREQTQEAATCPHQQHLWVFAHQCRSPFHQPITSLLNTLKLRRELHLRKRQ